MGRFADAVVFVRGARDGARDLRRRGNGQTEAKERADERVFGAAHRRVPVSGATGDHSEACAIQRLSAVDGGAQR